MYTHMRSEIFQIPVSFGERRRYPHTLHPSPAEGGRVKVQADINNNIIIMTTHLHSLINSVNILIYITINNPLRGPSYISLLLQYVCTYVCT